MAIACNFGGGRGDVNSTVSKRFQAPVDDVRGLPNNTTPLDPYSERPLSRLKYSLGT